MIKRVSRSGKPDKPDEPDEPTINPFEAVPMKETEYDFPSALLDAAQVARSERRAEQPKYNDDLAKVVARASLIESLDRSDADTYLNTTKINAPMAGKKACTDLNPEVFEGDSLGLVSITKGGVKDWMIDPKALPYTNQVNTFQYSTPTAGVGSITEKYNLADLGILQIIVAQAQVTFTAAGTAFMTLSTDKIWPTNGYKGVTGTAPSTFQPFLIAESPANPTAVTSGLSHDDANGYRMQMQASAAGAYKLTYVLGNIAADRIETPFER